MKARLLSTVALLLTLCGCNGGERKQIEQTAFAYLDAMGNYRIEEAKPYSSPRTIETAIALCERIMPSVDTSYIKSNTPAQITIKSVHIETDTTAYVLFHKSTPITQQDDTLRLVKIEGKWLANVVINLPNSLSDDTIPARERRLTQEQLKSMEARPIDTSYHPNQLPKQ